MASLLSLMVSLGAGDRGRTGTVLSYHGILSPGRLPVPPHRHKTQENFAPLSVCAIDYNTKISHCQVLFKNSFPFHAFFADIYRIPFHSFFFDGILHIFFPLFAHLFPLKKEFIKHLRLTFSEKVKRFLFKR